MDLSLILNERVKSSSTGKELDQVIQELQEHVFVSEVRNTQPKFLKKLRRIQRHKVRGAQLKELKRLECELAGCNANVKAVEAIECKRRKVAVREDNDVVVNGLDSGHHRPLLFGVSEPLLGVEAEYIIACATNVGRYRTHDYVRGETFWRVNVGKCDIKLYKIVRDDVTWTILLADATWRAQHPESESWWRQCTQPSACNSKHSRALTAGEEYGAPNPLLEDGVLLLPTFRAEIKAHLQALAVEQPFTGKVNWCLGLTFTAMYNFLTVMKRLNRREFRNDVHHVHHV